MNVIKLSAASIAILGALVASPAVHAHATLNAGSSGANPIWTNGAIADWMPNTVTVPSIGYLGIHGISNKRVIQTGLYNYAYAAADVTNANGVITSGTAGATAEQLGGIFGGATPTVGDSLQGQLRKYNEVTNTPGSTTGDLPTTGSISVGQNSWAGGISDANSSLSWGNLHISTGTGNPEANLMPTVNYLNVTVGDDLLFTGTNQLAFSVYQGWATGPGMQGLNLLGTVLASSAGQDIGMSIALSGLTMNGAGTEGEYTIVVGDQSTGGTFDGHYRMALEASLTARYGNVVSASAVPVPGAVWLFGSAMAGLIGFGRRKQIAA
jgi:hypothetical protein